MADRTDICRHIDAVEYQVPYCAKSVCTKERRPESEDGSKEISVESGIDSVDYEA